MPVTSVVFHMHGDQAVMHIFPLSSHFSLTIDLGAEQYTDIVVVQDNEPYPWFQNRLASRVMLELSCSLQQQSSGSS